MIPLRSILWATIAALLGGLVGAVWGPGWAALAPAVFLGALLIRHERWLTELADWARAPLGHPVPVAEGAWGEALRALARRAQESFRQREEIARLGERFRQMLDALPDGVLVLRGEQNVIEWMNARAADLLELSAEQDLGLPVTHLVREPEFLAFLARPTAEGETSLTLRLLRNPERLLELREAPFLGDGRLLLIADKTRLAQLETMRRDFVANVSHELRTPLSVVLGFLETARENLAQPEPDYAEIAQSLAYASEYAQRIERLVADLLTLSQLETSAPPKAERADAAALVSAVAEEARALSRGSHEITVVCEGPAYVLGSERELSSAFGNLVANAVRYTPAGGHIALSWLHAEGGGGMFVVRDDGPGIAAEHLPRLTERFYRVDAGRSRATGGTGLGLAIVKHVLERHGARLVIESTPGVGSCFAAVFPASSVEDR